MDFLIPEGFFRKSISVRILYAIYNNNTRKDGFGYMEKCLCFGILEGEWISLRSHLGPGDCKWFSFWFCHVYNTEPCIFIPWKRMELKKKETSDRRNRVLYNLFNDTFLPLFEKILGSNETFSVTLSQ